MGGFGDNDVFYYKVHSPVLLVEFDMHKGVFLDNDEPESSTSTSWSARRTATTTCRSLLRQHLERFYRSSPAIFMLQWVGVHRSGNRCLIQRVWSNYLN